MAWAAADLAARHGAKICSVDLMREVAGYDEIDCRVMPEEPDHLWREH